MSTQLKEAHSTTRTKQKHVHNNNNGKNDRKNKDMSIPTFLPVPDSIHALQPHQPAIHHHHRTTADGNEFTGNCFPLRRGSWLAVVSSCGPWLASGDTNYLGPDARARVLNLLWPLLARAGCGVEGWGLGEGRL